MKIIYVYKDPPGEDQTLVLHTNGVPRIGDIVRITNFPDIEEHYVVTQVLWSLHKDESLNPDVEATVLLSQRNKEWLGL